MCSQRTMNPNINRLHEILNQSMALLDEAANLVQSVGLEPKHQNLKNIGEAIGHILHTRKSIYDVEPSLRTEGK